MTRQQLLEIILDQKSLTQVKNFVPRYHQFLEDDKSGFISIITGIRRCGKSTLLNEIRQVREEKDYYLNFDDERLISFTVSDFQLLTELFIEKFGKQTTFYFDEIQNVTGWERYIRHLHDKGNKVYLTGSNARMLSRELGTHLTGRYIQMDIYPFSFYEYAVYNKIKYDPDLALTTEGKADYRRLFTQYMETGGIPEYVKTGNKDYLRSLYEGILYRDILTRNKLTKEKEVKELLYYIAGNFSKEITQNSLARVIGVKNSTTIKDYLTYFEDSYLAFILMKYDDSVKRQLLAPRKVYFIDNALANTLSFRRNDDSGRFLENLVFLELKRRSKDIFYFRGKHECDFVYKSRNSSINIIQVSHDLSSPITRERETSGLVEALDYFGIDEGYILTITEEEVLDLNGRKLFIKPVWKWLLE